MTFRDNKHMRFENHGLVTEVMLSPTGEGEHYSVVVRQRKLGEVQWQTTRFIGVRSAMELEFTEQASTYLHQEFNWGGDNGPMVNATTQSGLNAAAVGDLL